MTMNSRRTNREAAILMVILYNAFACVPFAQQAKPPEQLPVPPPMRVVPRQERPQLADAKDEKARIRLTIELSDTHLETAEHHVAKQDFEAALTELGYYMGLIDDGLRFLGKLNHDGKKPRDLYKRLELALRAQGPRLTMMRRVTPLEYSTRIKEIEESARDGRTEALNSFYGQTVMREEKQKPDRDSKTKDSSNRPER